jgi:hypothetical protein
MSKTRNAPTRVNDLTRPKSDEKSLIRSVVDIAGGAGPDGAVVLGSMVCIAHYGRTDLSFFIYALVATWSLLAFRLLSSRRGAPRRASQANPRRRGGARAP